MKAALNGALNLSILDGWWNEFYDDRNGWAIPSADSAGDGAERDALEAASLYDLIEHQVAPRFYDRDRDGVPTKWVSDIRHTLATLSPALSADRMVREYVEQRYTPAAVAERAITASSYQPARDLSAWCARVTAGWPGVHVAHVESGGVDATPQIGEELHVRAYVVLGDLTPDDVKVELVHGRASEADDLSEVHRIRLTLESAEPGQPATFEGTVRLERPGSFGSTVRVVPRHPLRATPADLGLIAVACRVLGPDGYRAMSASMADVARSRSAGASSSSKPRRPPLTNTVSHSSAVSSSTVGERVFCPIGLMPPTT